MEKYVHYKMKTPPPFQKLTSVLHPATLLSCPQCTMHWEEHQPRGILNSLAKKHYPLSRSVFRFPCLEKNGSYNTFPGYVTDVVRIMKSWSVGTIFGMPNMCKVLNDRR